MTIRERVSANTVKKYLTGNLTGAPPYATTVPDVTEPGELELILPNGTKVSNLAAPYLKKNHMRYMGVEHWSIDVVRLSTNESFEVKVKEEMLGDHDHYMELVRLMKFEEPASPTEEESDEFRTIWEGYRDMFLTQPDWELFEGVAPPKEDVTSVVVFLIVLASCAVIGILWYVRAGKRS